MTDLHQEQTNEEWSSQLWTQFMQLRKKPKKKKNVDDIEVSDILQEREIPSRKGFFSRRVRRA